eukprot:CAMPEP_0176433216 /NCGR_PEP_ID=MMETSP0127-20121128/15873_1 /TAXON_ID=938130 /ORGANISM="Platyophrya macrostoma, Strain WH" /LENGTH=153 /DNA_ID=CAMNT_0017815567 /DNA_START=129 /DNA_END=590 /DNA_ORIENTATION=+
MIKQLNHYEALGLPTSATANDIRAAYKSLALKFHPDKNTDKETATIIFNRIHEAYQTLIDKKLKHAYDSKRIFGETKPRMQKSEFETDINAFFDSSLVKEALARMEELSKVLGAFNQRTSWERRDYVEHISLNSQSRKISKKFQQMPQIYKKS